MAWPGEIELLLACARPHMRDHDRERAGRAVQSGLDWDRVLQYGRAHRLLPLLNLHADRVGMPRAPREALKARCLQSARRGFRLSRELREILRALPAAGIAALPLKGPVLAEAVYGAIALRDFDDLDLLVPLDRLAAAGALLEARGYEPVSHVPAPWRAFEARLLHHVGYRSRAAGIGLELHHSLLAAASGRRYRLEDLPLERGSFLGVPIDMLGPEETFVYLCQHGSAHAWARLEWLATAAALLRSGRVRDWPRVRHAAEAWHGTRRVAAAIGLIRALMHDSVADAVDLPAPPASAIETVTARLSTDPGRARETSIESYAFQMRTDDRVSARARRTWQVLFSPHIADLQALPLPRAARPMYAIARPIRLLVRRLRPRPRNP